MKRIIFCMCASVLLVAAFFAGRFSASSGQTLSGPSVHISADPPPPGGLFTLGAFSRINHEVESFLSGTANYSGRHWVTPQCLVLPEGDSGYQLIFYAGHPAREFPPELQERTQEFIRQRLDELSEEERQQRLSP